MANTRNTFSVWPMMIDMLTSVLIIFILINYFDNLLNPQEFEQVLIDLKRQEFINRLDNTFTTEKERETMTREAKFNFLQITFSGGILFQKGDHLLMGNGRRILSRLAPLLNNHRRSGISQIQIEGHTDEDPVNSKTCLPSDNWELSALRAVSVINFLTSYHIPPEIFSANAFSQYRPVSNDFSQNRRIEIKIYFTAEELN